MVICRVYRLLILYDRTVELSIVPVPIVVPITDTSGRMIDLIDLFYKSTRCVIFFWGLFILGSFTTLFISIEILDLFIQHSIPIITPLIKWLIRYRYHLMHAASQQSFHGLSFAFLIQVVFASSGTFFQYLKELFIAVFLYHAMRRYTGETV